MNGPISKSFIVTTILYARVSTSDQHVDHQIKQAREFAARLGLEVNEVIADHGVSGVSAKLAERAEGRRLFDMLRRGDTLIVRWVDRLGRNYEDVTDTIRAFLRRGVIVRTIINEMVFDGATVDPIQVAVRDAMIAFMAATAQAQAEATKIAQRAGIEAAKEREPEKFRGRKPSFDRNQLAQVCAMLDAEHGASEIARAVGLNRLAVLRIGQDRAKAWAALERWGGVAA